MFKLRQKINQLCIVVDYTMEYPKNWQRIHLHLFNFDRVYATASNSTAYTHVNYNFSSIPGNSCEANMATSVLEWSVR